MTKRTKRTGKLPKLSKTPVPVLLSVVVGNTRSRIENGVAAPDTTRAYFPHQSSRCSLAFIHRRISK